MKEIIRPNENEPLNVGIMREEIQDQTLEQKRKMLETKLRLREGQILQLYLACPNDELEPIVRYFNEVIGAPDKEIKRVALDPALFNGVGDLTSKIHELESSFAESEADRMLVLVSGFADLIKDNMQERGLWRIGHDYNQAISEHRRNERPLQIPDGRTLVIITHIDYSLGNDVTEATIKTAVRSQFSDDILEVNNPFKRKIETVNLNRFEL